VFDLLALAEAFSAQAGKASSSSSAMVILSKIKTSNHAIFKKFLCIATCDWGNASEL
jgi:hypothetical protein